MIARMAWLSDERKDYRAATLDVADLGADPIAALARWIDVARDAGAPEPTAMVLSTVDADGTPSGRVLLCKGVDGDGLRFFTNYDSRKGRALAAGPHAAATFFWPSLERQARVEGVTERLPRAESEAYFHSRPRGSQLAAAASAQSRAIAARAPLEAEVARLDAAHPQRVPIPEAWGGYVLRPLAIEFWQGRPSRLHDRVLFTRASVDAAWSATRLQP